MRLFGPLKRNRFNLQAGELTAKYKQDPDHSRGPAGGDNYNNNNNKKSL